MSRMAPLSAIKNLTGKNRKSSIVPKLIYDSRNNAFNATKGSIYGLEGEFAGLGGDVGFAKVVGEVAWYIPSVLGIHWCSACQKRLYHRYKRQECCRTMKNSIWAASIRCGDLAVNDLAPRDSDGAPSSAAISMFNSTSNSNSRSWRKPVFSGLFSLTPEIFI